MLKMAVHSQVLAVTERRVSMTMDEPNGPPTTFSNWKKNLPWNLL